MNDVMFWMDPALTWEAVLVNAIVWFVFALTAAALCMLTVFIKPVKKGKGRVYILCCLLGVAVYSAVQPLFPTPQALWVLAASLIAAAVGMLAEWLILRRFQTSAKRLAIALVTQAFVIQFVYFAVENAAVAVLMAFR